VARLRASNIAPIEDALVALALVRYARRIGASDHLRQCSARAEELLAGLAPDDASLAASLTRRHGVPRMPRSRGR
jgi:hypothetical protein